MWSYHFSEAKRSLLSHPKLSFLVVATMGIGIALLMVMLTNVYQQSRVPIKHLAEDIYLIATDNRGIDADPLAERYHMPPLSWQDAMYFYQGNVPASLQSLNYTMRFIVEKEDRSSRPVWAEGSATDRHFFQLFEPPFLYGSGWSESADVAGEPVVVLSKDMNMTLFNGENSVGKTLKVAEGNLTVVGVMDDWEMNQLFYDRGFSDREKHQIFVPMNLAMERNFTRAGWMSCSQAERDALGDIRRGDMQALKSSQCGWLHLWAHIADDNSVQDYKDIVALRIGDERNRGLYPRETDFIVMQLKHMVDSIGGDTWSSTLLVLAWLFFGVCIVNTIGILLAKFLAHTKQVCLYRALGATKVQILKQHLLEVVILGLAGALLGLFLSWFGLQLMFQVEMYQMDYDGDPKVVKQFFSLDVRLIFTAIGIAISSIVVAGLYPIYKVCNISPAGQLRS